MDTALRKQILARKRAGDSEASSKSLPLQESGQSWRSNPRYRGLIPIKPGEVLNPKGINQYTAGASYRDQLDKVWLERALKNPETIQPKDYKGVLCLQCGMGSCDRHLGFNIFTHASCLELLAGLTVIQICALQERRLVLCGDDDARTHMRKTFTPAPKSLTLQGDPDNPIMITQITRRIIDESRDIDT